MNSICLLFLLMGVIGAKPATVASVPPAASVETLPTIIAPVVTPPPAAMQELMPEEEPRPERPESAPVLAVAPHTPDIAFAVPTIGDLLVPVALAVAPPPQPKVAPVAEPVAMADAPQPVVLNNTGMGGERPYPPYPPAALERQQEGTVVLLLTVDGAGMIVTIDVKTTSGSMILDRSTLDFVRRHWRVPPGAGSRSFEATVTYRLESH